MLPPAHPPVSCSDMANVRIISHYLKEWGVIVQKSARRLENSAVLAENSKRLADFCGMLARCCVLLSTLPSALSGFSFLDLRRAA